MRLKISSFILFLFVSLSTYSQKPLSVNVIMKRVMDAAEKYNGLVEHYDADVYMRTYVETIKKNFLYKYTHFIPNFVLFDPKSDQALIETIGKLKYTYPKYYVQDIKHVIGTIHKKKDIEMLPYNFLSINMYDETTFNDKFIMPLRLSCSRYYTYSLQQTYTDNNKIYYTIDFTPIYESPKLLRGSCVIEEGTWRVVRFFAEGVDLMTKFSFEVTTGNEWVTNYLPTDFIIYRATSFLGNTIAERYLAKIKYNDAKLRINLIKKKKLDLSNYFKVRLDSVPLHNDSAFWNKMRPFSLQAKESEVLHDFERKQAEKEKNAKTDSIDNNKKVQQIAKRMVMDSNYKYKSTKIGYSGLLNPFMIGYSSKDGVTYRQKLYFQTNFANKKSIQISMFMGYVFKRNEFFSDLAFRWNYEPRYLGNLSLSVGNGNRTYSSLFVNQIQDSLINKGLKFDDISVDYYKDYYLRLYNNIEIANGFLLGTGIEYHIRKASNRKMEFKSISGSTDGIDKMFGTRYAFMPFIYLAWTPEQYYRFEGRQKIYVKSRYPTFKLQFGRSFKDIFKSTSQYDRVEMDISQNVDFGLMKSLQYHVGGGFFVNQKTEYFADFIFFAKNNFLENWNDGIGGNFNLLRRSLYNASDSYLQAHLMYQTPFLILKNIPFVSKGVLYERLYISQLYTPQIVSYSEVGYGIGNRFFNAAFFCSFHKLYFKEVGIRAALAF